MQQDEGRRDDGPSGHGTTREGPGRGRHRGSRRPPPGPTRPEFWRSPVRGVRFTSVLGVVLLVGVPVLFLTGLLSYAAYNPDLRGNDTTPDRGWLGFYLFAWPTDPHWLYRLTQGVHVTLGIVLIPVLLAKLWSVIPRLFVWPPLRSLSHALERLSLLLLVGGALFVFATGVLNVQLDYVFPGSFYPLHFYGSWVFAAAFVVHVAFRIPVVVRALRGRHWAEGAEERAGLAAPRPAAATVSRRGALGLVGAGSVLLFAVTAGQSLGGSLRRTALLAPHGQDTGPGPNGFQVNKTPAAVGIRAEQLGDGWRLVVRGRGRQEVFTRARLLELPQDEASLPIACVEGWSTVDQRWGGVRLTRLAALVGYEEAGTAPGVFVESVQRRGAFRSASLRDNQVRDPRSLLALRVNGAELSPDHGYPARIIVPAAPGVHNTKWVTRLTFGEV
ncbi:molybdopterin-dependent oxidoreductase [Streptomyces sp. JJ38]|uniref:molybdopterin-dependent oxidoreductase n=1 Tax=Streptomyces sp. JJ38 TaxID=2738128 RepID=UPI001C590E07|nr:molybdopterin-dependent oxidoreductase [Streptomyces sp. JJ38]